jgi:hypothetical protein
VHFQLSSADLVYSVRPVRLVLFFGVYVTHALYFDADCYCHCCPVVSFRDDQLSPLGVLGKRNNSGLDLQANEQIVATSFARQ